METKSDQEGEPLEKGKSRKKRGGKEKWLLLLVLLLLLLAAGAAFLVMRKPVPSQPQSQYDLDANALAGFLPGHSDEEIQAELDRIIEKGFFNVAINPTPVLKTDGKLNLNIENVPANHYLMQVNVYLIDKDGKEILIYRSGVIKPGFYIGTVTLTGKLPPPGKYNGRADFSALYPDTQENIGQTSATMLVTVEGGAEQ